MKPWCWYCDRSFEDEKILIDHQRAKHLKCSHCNKKMNTAGGLAVHCQQVHKETITKLENCLPGRDSVDVEIFGMEGIPEADLQAHIDQVQGGSAANKRAHLVQMNPDALKLQLAAFQAQKESIAASSAAIPPPGPFPPVSFPPAPPGFAPVGFPQPFAPPIPAQFPIPTPLPIPVPQAAPVGFPPPPPSLVSHPAPPLPVPVAPAPIPVSSGALSADDSTQVPASKSEEASSSTESLFGEYMYGTIVGGAFLVYGDNEESVEEKRSKSTKYAVTV